jgi:FG-GAP repeat
MNNQTFRTGRMLFSALVMGLVVLAAPALGQVINEDVKLLPSDGATGDEFGYSIAIANGVVAVGAHLNDDNGISSGSAYLFDAATGVEIAKLLPSDGATDDEFGYSIAIANGVVAVGAHLNDDNGISSGSAYLFDASTGAQIAKLLPSDGAIVDYFGWSIAIANGVVAVGAPYDDDNGTNSGSVYLFNASTGAQIAKLISSDGAGFDEFGFSIAIANGVVAVGAYRDDDNGFWSGSAYLFDAATGVEIAKLLPSDGAAEDRFGYSIAIANGVVAVGAHGDDDNGGWSGSAYLFDVATGVEIAKLLPSDGAGFDRFGDSIAIANGVVAVGAYRDDDNGSWSGSVYLFDAATGVEIAKLLPSDGAEGDSFGDAIAIAKGVVAVGAWRDGDNGSDSGSAYVFAVPGEDCPADLTGDGSLNFFDVSAFLTAFASEDPAADFTGDGAFNFFDVSAFLAAFAAGCP